MELVQSKILSFVAFFPCHFYCTTTVYFSILMQFGTKFKVTILIYFSTCTRSLHSWSNYASLTLLHYYTRILFFSCSWIWEILIFFLLSWICTPMYHSYRPSIAFFLGVLIILHVQCQKIFVLSWRASYWFKLQYASMHCKRIIEIFYPSCEIMMPMHAMLTFTLI